MMSSTSESGHPVSVLPADVPVTSVFPDPDGNDPIRAELYGLEHLEAHAKQLAAPAAVALVVRGRPLLRRFAQNGRALVRAHQLINEAYRRREHFGSDAEWLLDNFHIVDDALREVRTDLPRGYYQLLPKLASGPLAGFPRVYVLALELIAHCDSSLDEVHITRFVQAYQTVTPLTIGELWAVPIMLRLGLVDNLRRLAEQILKTRADRHEAQAWAARWFAHQEHDPNTAQDNSLPSSLRPQSDWSDPFVVQLLEVLRGHESFTGGRIEWLESFLSERGLTSAEVLRREQQRQAANQVSIGNCVTSLRLLSALDWTVFFERTSLVEAILGEDPAEVYARQDFRTRDRYRKVVERLAQGSGLSELEVSRRILNLAAREKPTGSPDGAAGESIDRVRRSHVGYYLIDQGRKELEADIHYRAAWRDGLLNFVLSHPQMSYFGGLALITILVLVGLAVYGSWQSTTGTEWLLVVLTVLALLPASELAVSLVNWLVPWFVPPRVLPKLVFKEGIPADCATFVVIPSLLSRPESADVLVQRLELHYLANPDPQLRFALLTDFTDAPNEHMPEDESYVRSALDGIKALNERYPLPPPPPGGKGDGDVPARFFLFHRRRRWNPVQGCWMGWERKRGKLAEFNRLVRGAHDTSFNVVSSDPSHLSIRFVITLDADTQLPHEAAQRLIATLAHPLNQPVFDRRQQRVVAGYGVLQPRIGLSLTGARKSLFARLYSGSAGIDPYTTAVSDVYQDLFGIGSFTGKGIYDLDAFEAAAGHTFPDNQILSHDLIEGNYARCGLVTDIELLDEFPASSHACLRRDHRWARGDWQILPWLFPKAPARKADGERMEDESDRTDVDSSFTVQHSFFQKNPLPFVERWKIFDNLRRSLLPVALVGLLLLGWTVLPGSAWFWTAFVLAIIAWPLLIHLGKFPFLLLRGELGALAWRDFFSTLWATGGQVLLATVFLLEQARSMLDAVSLTLIRLYVTRRNLLEWETAAATERRLGSGFRDSCRSMWAAPLLAAAVGPVLFIFRPEALFVAGPILLAWLASPAIAYWVSRPARPSQVTVSDPERRQLRRLARKTWSFFETFVGDEDNYLPPDNFQEDPKGQVAHRTSPTNIGLYLLSCLTAHDFGYLSLPALVERLEKTFATLDRLERSHGHFLNWYDTRTLRPLLPAYLSTVDSGNLAGCLLALKQGLREKIEEPLSLPTLREGLADTLALVAETVRPLFPPGQNSPPGTLLALNQPLEKLSRLLQEAPGDRQDWDKWLQSLDRQTEELTHQVQLFAAEIHEPVDELQRWVQLFADQISDRHDELKNATDNDLAGRCQRLADRADTLTREMDFRIVYNERRHLFAVGYNLTLGRLDNAHYDLLASEASLTSFLAIARGDAPPRHWFQLSRPLTRAASSTALLSWGGTMFEYLMPRLLLRSIPDTLLDESQRGAVARQVEYGRQCRVPWGISESAFSAVDSELNYHYLAFGVPGLGLKRGLAKDLVIAPYASMLAVEIDPQLALKNFQRLTEEGGEGRYGFYEAIDYTADRLPPQRRSVVVKCFMAHHQGMGLVALANCLFDNLMPRRFHAEPMVQATELLLQERVPPSVPLVEAHADEANLPPSVPEGLHQMSRRITTPDTTYPRTHLLSNGNYSVMVTNAGSGRSTCNGLAVTRWREDRTCDAWGQFCYVRDLPTGLVWAAGHQPVCRDADEYEVAFSIDKADLRRMDGGIETHLEITVSPESCAEVRRLTFTNHHSRVHDIEVTTYAEVVLGPHGADLAHPAFGKLFVETEFVPAEEALLCRRRPRSPEQKPIWGIHVLAVDCPTVGPPQYETDRMRFIGRGRNLAHPAALDRGAVLSQTTGPVLDPIFSLRRRIRLAPETAVCIAFTTGTAETREEALALADQYHDFHGVTRAFELAWAHSQVELRHLRLSAEEAHLYQRLAAHIFFAGATLRASSVVMSTNRQGQPGLWRHGISGDYPIVLVRVTEAEELPLVRQMLSAHTYWRLKGLEVDLVVLNEHEAGYFEDLHQQLQALVRSSDDRDRIDKPGGAFVRKLSHMSREDQVLLQSAARCVLVGNRGSLASQIERLERPVPWKESRRHGGRETRRPGDKETGRQGDRETGREGDPRSSLGFFNGKGGFTPDGREYVIRLRPGTNPGKQRGSVSLSPAPLVSLSSSLPPAPWVNVVANPFFGFLISEGGSGYTWAGNCQTNRLTPWSNDPVSDPPGEVLYLRDEATGEVWTPTPLPLPMTGAYSVRHGQGYTVFEHTSHGLGHELTLFVPPDDPIKLIRLKVRNLGRQSRRLSATFYAEWVLGTVRDQAPMNVITELDAESGALLARNAFNADFGAHVAFADVSLRPRSYTADRTEFLGRNGSLSAPSALDARELGGSMGAALDPCAALQAPFELRSGETKEVVFYLGQAAGMNDVHRLLRRYREPGRVSATLQEVRGRWDQVLTTVQVRTPNPALDLLMNRWVLYQVLSCRMWARSGFYQSGGAYGFRDQLQDSMALVYSAPQEVRAQILRAAGRQFREGDVQHWWHPPHGAGVRTRFSDDFLWLPFVVCHYVKTTGDAAILQERVPFLQAPLLRPEQEEDYRVPEVSEEIGTLYEHCVRAIANGCRFGAHGLPLMGTGDWNDGMNRVGHGGKGESVWNGWFLLTILPDFADLAEAFGETERATHYRELVTQLRAAIEEHAWDGRWYRRAYFDDGTPLGSSQSAECIIDSLAQSWAVISGAADPLTLPSTGGEEGRVRGERARQAMAAVEEYLVREVDRLILLFTPPFDKGSLEPGYIKGYVPGIRENGGQYTHAAIWVVQATALLGHGNRALELFDLLNPIHHATSAEEVERYRVEPYVVAADIYGEQPHTGRGGWTWYTGSAGWLYRVALESILGFRLRGDKLSMNPCIPSHWQEYEITYRHNSTTYHLKVINPQGVQRGVQTVIVDGKTQEADAIELVDDGKLHEVKVILG